MNHQIQIIPTLDSSTPVCSCGKMAHREFFGSRRTANAKQHIFRHLESAYSVTASGFGTEGSEPEFHVTVSDSMNCPLCEADLDLSKDDLGLLSENDPSVINCSNGHEFDAYYRKNTLFLYYSQDVTPFDTSP
jgi:hypothetical protein